MKYLSFVWNIAEVGNRIRSHCLIIPSSTCPLRWGPVPYYTMLISFYWLYLKRGVWRLPEPADLRAPLRVPWKAYSALDQLSSHAQLPLWLHVRALPSVFTCWLWHKAFAFVLSKMWPRFICIFFSSLILGHIRMIWKVELFAFFLLSSPTIFKIHSWSLALSID